MDQTPNADLPQQGHAAPWSASVLGVRVDDIAIPDLLARIQAAMTDGTRLCVVNANVHLINLARQRPWLTALFRRADIAFCDGAGVQFAVWALTGRKPHRHTPPQWAPELGRRLAADDRGVFWLGGRPDVVATAARRFTAQTGLRAVGWHHGYFDPTPGCAENDAVIAAINAARPDLLLLGMGMPLQERWLDQNWSRLTVPVAITAGALVDHAAGRVARPPLWVADLGLEWLVRLLVEPRRLWRRYLIGLPHFAWRLAPEIWRGKARSGGSPPNPRLGASAPRTASLEVSPRSAASPPSDAGLGALAPVVRSTLARDGVSSLERGGQRPWPGFSAGVPAPITGDI